MISEAPTQQQIRLAASRRSAYLWRNNSGVLRDANDNYVRFGLANDSKRVNDELKSSDLIGFTPVLITPDMVGRTVAVFTAVEVKHPGWIGVRTARERAQNAFIALVNSFGGRAGFATTVEEAERIMEST